MATAMTVLGPIPVQELGRTLMHEHLLIDFRCRYIGTPESDTIGDDLDLRDRWKLVTAPAAYRANLLRDDVSVAIDEVAAFSHAGGSTIVDVTTKGLGPDAVALRSIAEASGANVIASTGFYTHVSHAPDVCAASVEDLAKRMIRDIVDPDADGIQRGFIGEIGVDGPTACEMDTVRAAAIAQKETGAAVSIHLLGGVLPETRADALAVVEEFIGQGGDPCRLIVCHSDGSGDDPSYQQALLERGVVLEYDTFGFQSVFAYKDRFVQMPTDSRRITEVADLWSRGWKDQVVLSQDVCYRMMSREWGGWGIGHILGSLMGRFESAGLGSTEMDTMLVETPRRLLGFN